MPEMAWEEQTYVVSMSRREQVVRGVPYSRGWLGYHHPDSVSELQT